MDSTSQQNQMVQSLRKLKHYVRESQYVHGEESTIIQRKIIQELQGLKSLMPQSASRTEFKYLIAREFESMGEYDTVREILAYLESLDDKRY